MPFITLKHNFVAVQVLKISDQASTSSGLHDVKVTSISIKIKSQKE